MPTIDVKAGQDLQAALDAAQPGDTLRLDAAGTWSADYLLPVKSGDTSGQITITTSNIETLPLVGNRVTEEQSLAMPRIKGHVKTMPRSAHYTFRGIRIEAYADYYTGGLVDFGGQGINNDIVVNVAEDLPRDFTIDRCWLQADPGWGGKRGIYANCAGLVVKDSVVKDFFSDSQDSQAIGCTNGPGPFTIENCYLSATGENIMFGGACPAIPGLIPSDITVRHCWLHKPESWRAQKGQREGQVSAPRLKLVRGRHGRPDRHSSYNYAVKNLFELKNAHNVRVEDCILEGCWHDAQAGFAVQLTVRTCEAGDYAWATVSDVLMQNCLIISECGINILGTDGARDYCPPPPTAGTAYNLAFRNNDIRASWCWQIMSEAHDILIERNSCDHNYGAMLAFDSVPDAETMTRLKVQQNRFSFGSGIAGSGAGPGSQALDMYWDEWLFAGNAVYRVPSSEMWWIADGTGTWYPADNLYTDSQEPTPGYGCDTAALEAALAHVRDGQGAGNPGPTPVVIGTLHLDETTPPGDYPVYATSVA